MSELCFPRISVPADKPMAYPSAYAGSREISEQMAILSRFFPKLKPNRQIIPMPTLVESGMEGYFAIPRWQKIANSYANAAVRVLDTLRETRPLYNEQRKRINETDLRRVPRSAARWAHIEERYKRDDFVIVPGQFGHRYAGLPAIDCREQQLRFGEFGLGLYEGAIMLLTHRERLSTLRDLGLLCVGDVFTSVPLFECVPCFDIVGRLRLISVGVSYASAYNGPITAYAN